jgi:hypothetical protein
MHHNMRWRSSAVQMLCAIVGICSAMPLVQAQERITGEQFMILRMGTVALLLLDIAPTLQGITTAPLLTSDDLGTSACAASTASDHWAKKFDRMQLPMYNPCHLACNLDQYNKKCNRTIAAHVRVQQGLYIWESTGSQITFGCIFVCNLLSRHYHTFDAVILA